MSKQNVNQLFWFSASKGHKHYCCKAAHANDKWCGKWILLVQPAINMWFDSAQHPLNQILWVYLKRAVFWRVKKGRYCGALLQNMSKQAHTSVTNWSGSSISPEEDPMWPVGKIQLTSFTAGCHGSGGKAEADAAPYATRVMMIPDETGARRHRGAFVGPDPTHLKKCRSRSV